MKARGTVILIVMEVKHEQTTVAEEKETYTKIVKLYPAKPSLLYYELLIVITVFIFIIQQVNVLQYNTLNSTLTYYFEIC